MNKTSVSVVSIGIGRKDYSVNVEYSVQPLIRSWQDKYSYSNLIPVAAGAEVITVIPIPAADLYILYDLNISAEKNVLLRLQVDEWDPVTLAWIDAVFVKSGYQRVDLQIPDGFIFGDQYRVRVKNYSAFNLTIPLDISGIKASKANYTSS